MRLPPSVLRSAHARHGLVLLDDLKQAGLSLRQVELLVLGRHLLRLHSGIYRLPGAPPSWEQRQLAACFVTGGVASHRAATRLWGVDLGDRVPIEVTVARPNPARPQGVIVHRSADLPVGSPPTRKRIPVTTPQRTLVDLGAVASDDHVTRALEHCVVSQLVSIETVRNELAQVARRGRRGVQSLRRVLTDWPVDAVRPDSVLELAFARLCREAGLPTPVFQHPVTLAGRQRRIDFAYPDLMIAMEIDGFECRTDRNVFQDERRRQNDLIQAGWQVLRFTWQDITRRPGYVTQTIQAAVSRALERRPA